MFEPMHKFGLSGEKGVAKIKQFEVTKKESDRTSIRASMYPDEFVPPGIYTSLYVGKTLMMSDTLMEQNSNQWVVSKARGDVLIAGLGIGLILVPILRNPEVRSVTVVEMYQDVVDLVLPKIQENLSEASKMTVITADIFTWKPAVGTKWDTVYFDIWPEINQDNLKGMTTLHRRFGRRLNPGGWMDSWQRTRLQRAASR